MNRQDKSLYKSEKCFRFSGEKKSEISKKKLLLPPPPEKSEVEAAPITLRNKCPQLTFLGSHISIATFQALASLNTR